MTERRQLPYREANDADDLQHNDVHQEKTSTTQLSSIHGNPWKKARPIATSMKPHRTKPQNSAELSNQPPHRLIPGVELEHDRIRQTVPSHALKIAKANVCRTDKLNAKPVVQAYQDLLEQTRAMQLESIENATKRQMDKAVYQMGLVNISDEMVRKQKDLIRYHTFKNEVELFQQQLDPFVVEIRSDRERQVNSSVYRHYNRMRDIENMGIPIYNLSDYVIEEGDRVITARTTNPFYRRVRRRNVAHSIDTKHIPRLEKT